MKKVFFSILSCFIVLYTTAQTPQAIKYQAVARDNSGNIIANQNIGFRISILQNSPTGSFVYTETHTVSSNAFGLVNLDLGTGNIVNGTFSTINWGASNFFVKIEMDVNGANNYIFMGTSQLLSVPYALFAEKTNESQTLNLNGNILSISNGNSVTLNNSGTTYSAGNGININGNIISNSAPDQTVTLTGSGNTTVSGSYPNFSINSTSSGNSLDQAYDFGGAGQGRSITTDAGSVQINNSGSNSTALEINSSVANSSAVVANIGGTGVGFRAESSNPSNTFAAIQANTNSSSNQNSAILGNNSGAGYAVSGQIPANASGTAAVYGSNLRSNGGSGVSGIGFNGVVGQAQNAQGFGIYGINTNSATGTAPSLGIGSYGYGFNGIYGQTTNTNLGWAGYFTSDIGCDGAGYSNGGWVTASDRRLKSNISPINQALTKISGLEGMYYTISTKSIDENGKIKIKDRNQYGIIAQDLEKVFPEMISEKAIFINSGDDTVYKTVEYTQLIPVLIEAVKELNNKINLLEKEIEQMKKSK